MILAFPVEEYNGLDSEIYGNFGDAAGFVIYDNDTKEYRFKENSHFCRRPNECEPMQAFGGEKVNVVILSGIGPEPLKKLQMSGVQVIRANLGTVSENIAFFNDGSLICLTNRLTCGDKSVNCMCDCG